MASSIFVTLPFLSLAILLAAASAPYGPTCRSKSIFPYISCESQCTAYSRDILSKCQQKAQFGCYYRRCFRTNLECALNPMAEQNNPCPNGEVPVQNVTLQYSRPVEFDLAINLRGYPLDVVLLIDASAPSARINAVKPQLVSLLRKLDGTAKVGVAIYGAEQEFDSSGFSVLAAASEDVNPAIRALDHIPQKADGPRTTLTALRSLRSGGLHLSGFKEVVLLIGDSPGREPECGVGFDRVQTASDMFSYYSGIVLLPVNLGTPGLDAAIPAPEACSNSPIEPQPVSKGQASYIASETQGEIIESITADELFGAIDRARRTPGRINQNPPGSKISVSTASFPLHVGPYSVPDEYQRYSNGCEERVTATLTGTSEFVSAPAQTNAHVKLDVPATVCRSGPISCEVRIVERQQGHETMSHWSLPLVNYEVIKVNAC